MPPRPETSRTPALPGPGEAPLPSWPGEVVEVEGRALFVRRAGTSDGTPAVFVHGLGGASTNWTDLMALLGDRLDEHAVDLPGFGQSPPPADGRYTPGAHASAVAAYVRSLGAGPVHLFGNSLGGAVATRVAAEHPDLVTTLTLISPALPQYRLRRGNDPRLALLLLPGLSGLVNRQRARASAHKVALDVLTLCTYDVSVIHPDRVAALAEDLRRRRGFEHSAVAMTASLRGLVRSYFDAGPRNLWRQLGLIQAPTLVVWGDHDRLVPRSLGPAAVRRLRNGRLLRVADAGHIAQIERPEVVADAVRRLLDEVEGLRASA